MRNIPNSISPKECAFQAGVLLFLLVLVFPGTFLRGEVIAPGDILFQCPPWSCYAPPGWEGPQNRLMTDILTAFYPYYAISLLAWHNGEWPLWNPLEYAGMPLLANGQSAVLYPPRLVHLVFGLRWGTTLYILLKLWLCGATAYLCGRKLGLGTHAARFFSVAWMLASYNLIWCNWSLTDVSVWVPVLFLGAECVLAGRNGKGLFALAFAGTLMVLAGHPETAFTFSFGVGMYFVLRLIWERRWGLGLYRPIAVWCGAWVIALCAAAAQLIPFLEYLLNSADLANRLGAGPGNAVPPSTVVALWVPRFFGTFAEDTYWGDYNSNVYSMLYPGMAVWIGTLILLCGRNRAPIQRAQIGCLFLGGLLGILQAINAPPFSFLNHIPVLRAARAVYYSSFTIFSLPLLGAFGLEEWLGGPRRLRRVGLALVMTLVVGAFILFVFYFFYGLVRVKGVIDYVEFQLLLATIFGAGALVLFALFYFWNKRSWLGPALTALLACDLLLANRGLNPTLPAEGVFPRTQLTDFLRTVPQPSRMGVGEAYIASGLVSIYGIEEWLGYDGLYPERMIHFQRRLAEGIWEVMEPACAVQYIVHDPRLETDARFGPQFPLEKPGWFELVAELDNLEVYRNTRAFARAYLVRQYEVVDDLYQMFQRMASPDFHPNEVALVETDPGTPLPAPQQDYLGEARVTKYGTTRCTVEVDARSPAVLVLADAYYPGWRVWIDEKPAELFPVYYVFRGVIVPSGRHIVEYRYFPLSLRISLAISCLTLFLGILASVWRLSRFGMPKLAYQMTFWR